ncbi:parathyroid hormone 1a [Parambassis ranga]|uniref:Parathyroid hormone n=1 Tax=Parambassis ranga TaxID=210632 RepID=A0A6P7IMR7_9TELE|nr:parathyroid hormone [Parambassis ranga]
MDYRILFVSLCVLHLSFYCQGRPLRKRTVSEVQLMHNVGERKQVQERREWLQMRLRGIHTTATRDSSAEAAERRRKKLRPWEVLELRDMTSEEIQQALDFLDKLLKSKQS